MCVFGNTQRQPLLYFLVQLVKNSPGSSVDSEPSLLAFCTYFGRSADIRMVHDGTVIRREFFHGFREAFVQGQEFDQNKPVKVETTLPDPVPTKILADSFRHLVACPIRNICGQLVYMALCQFVNCIQLRQQNREPGHVGVDGEEG